MEKLLSREFIIVNSSLYLKSKITHSVFPLVRALFLVLLLYTFCRLLFYFFQQNYFSSLSALELIKLCVVGIRYDLSAILILNSPFIFISLLPFINNRNIFYHGIKKTLFVLVNALSILANCIDFAYFKFTLKRTTADIFFIRKDIAKMGSQYIFDYWYIALIWIFLLIGLIYFYPQSSHPIQFKNSRNIKSFLSDILILIVTAAISIIGIRGGFQLKPLRVITAAEYTEAPNIPLVINTPFSIIKTWNADFIQPFHFYEEKNPEKLFSFINEGKVGPMKKENVVVIILESFSKEYIGYFNKGKGFTPFLDSLIKFSFTFENSYANGKRSIEGVPAIVAGVPALTENPFITSVYGANHYEGLGTLLKKKGYHCSFFHGGTNGTMGFDAFSKLAGFDAYYGRNEYNNEKDYDGHWGIYDEPFYNYFVNELDKNAQPFCSVFFSISSHHPYTLPLKYKNRFPKGDLEIHESIGYSDYALRTFFNMAATKNWFKNTLFIITADHTSISKNPVYQTKSGVYSIPIIFFKADHSLSGQSSIIAQQIDILPSIMDQLNYDEKYFAYGKSLFAKDENRFAVTYQNGIYQSICNEQSLLFDGEKSIAYFNLKRDSLQQQNILSNHNNSQIKQEVRLKKYLQHFNQSLLENKMTAH